MRIFAANPASNAPMNSLSALTGPVLLFLLLFVGVYGLYTVFRLGKKRTLFANHFLYPGNCPPENCLDEEGFIDYILPRLCILSISALLMGIAFGVRLFVFPHVTSLVLELLIMILPLILLVWYAVIQHKASKIYW